MSILDPKGLYGFFRAHTGEEIDLVIDFKDKKIGFEFKASSAPKLTPKNYKAMEILGLDELNVITPSSDTYPLQGNNVRAISLKDYLESIRS